MICCRCENDLVETEFRWRDKSTGIRHTICKACNKDKDRAYYLNNKDRKKKLKKAKAIRRVKKKKWYDELRAELKCVRCGYNKCVQALEFHHRDPNEKDAAVSDIVRKDYSKERALKEMAKCDVLCANCHREEHFGTNRIYN